MFEILTTSLVLNNRAQKNNVQGPVVQNIDSFTSSLRGQLIKYFTALLLNTLIFLLKKMREAFALQKFLTFFSTKKYWGI